MKKFLLSLTALITALSILSGVYCIAVAEYALSDFENCGNTAAESNSHGAFVYGSDGKNVYASRLAPDPINYSVTVGGTVRKMCLDENYICALYTKTSELCLLRLDTDDGSYSEYSLGRIDVFARNIFSVSDSCVFLLSRGAEFTFVSKYNFSGELLDEYTFSVSAVSLFCNSGKTYVRLYDGSVYRLDASAAEYCASVPPDASIYNAGIDYIADSDGVLYPLNGGDAFYALEGETELIRVDSDFIYYVVGENILRRAFDSSETSVCCVNMIVNDFAVYGGSVLVLNQQFTGFTAADSDDFTLLPSDPDGGADDDTSSDDSSSEANSHAPSSVIEPADDASDKSDGSSAASPSAADNYYVSESEMIIYGVESGTKVSTFKSGFSSDVVLRNSLGSTVTSGNIKTGYYVITDTGTYGISVRGDVTGEGNVNSRDVKLLMRYLLGEEELSGAYKKSADYNYDGSIDNIDLVLISQYN